jgi:hypothetical protein
LVLIGPVDSEEKVFQWKVNDGWTEKRTTDATIIYWGNNILCCGNKIIYWGNKIICCGNKIVCGRNNISFLWEQTKLWEQDIILREQTKKTFSHGHNQPPHRCEMFMNKLFSYLAFLIKMANVNVYVVKMFNCVDNREILSLCLFSPLATTCIHHELRNFLYCFARPIMFIRKYFPHFTLNRYCKVTKYLKVKRTFSFK